MAKTVNIKSTPNIITPKGWSPKTGTESDIYINFDERREQMRDSKQNIEGKDIEQMMAQADDNYLLYKDLTAEKGMSNLKTNRVFSKIWTAVSQLFTGEVLDIYKAGSRKYRWNTLLMRELGRKSWRNGRGDWQLLLFIFNMVQKGTGIGRTYHRYVKEPGKFLESVDKKGNSKYSTRDIVKFDDVYFQSLDPRGVLLDDKATPFDKYSMDDWSWDILISWDAFKLMFPVKEYPNAEFVSPLRGLDKHDDNYGNNSNISSGPGVSETFNGVKVKFYENRPLDQFIIVANDVMISADPLPNNKKELSLIYAPNILRNSKSLWGVSYFELLQADEEMQDTVLNMTMDQLKLSIFQAGFYEGTEELDSEYWKVKPGVFKRKNPGTKIDVINQKSPGGAELNFLELGDKRMDDKTVPKSLSGELTGSTAFEVGSTKEEGLKRLRFPLRSLTYALIEERYIRKGLIEQVYSEPQVRQLVNEREIQEYKQEKALRDAKGVPMKTEGGELILRDDTFIKEGGKFFAKEFRNVALPLRRLRGDKGFEESTEENFFDIGKEELNWDGDIEIDIESLVVDSRALEINQTMTLANTIMPLLQLPPQIALKPLTEILKAMRKDPLEWLPDGKEWLVGFEAMQNRQNPKETETAQTQEQTVQQMIANATQSAQGQTPENTSPQNLAAQLQNQAPGQNKGALNPQQDPAGQGLGNEINPFAGQ